MSLSSSVIPVQVRAQRQELRPLTRKKLKWIPAFTGMTILFMCHSVFAQDAATPANTVTKQKVPVSVEASHELEWLRTENKYRATGDVVITQGTTVITGKQAEASYDPDQGPSALTHIVVTGGVTITDGDKKATSDTADYDTGTQLVKLRGNTPTVTAPDLNVAAQDGIDYYRNENKAVAMGHAVVKQKDQTLKAQKVTAWFDDKNKLQRAIADGNVVIIKSTPNGQDIAQSDHGDYSLPNDKAVLTGHVKITQGQNHMQGDIGTIKLSTGYSTLQNSGSGRVRAIFVPGNKSPQIAVPDVRAKKTFEPAYAVNGQATDTPAE